MDGRNISLRKVSTVVSYIVIVACLILGYKVTKDGDSLTVFGYRPVIVVSGSMEPAIMTNSISIVKECSVADVEVGDVVMYKFNGIRILHRAIGKDVDNKFINTKGDSNPEVDIINITDDMLVGKVVKTYNGVSKHINSLVTYKSGVDPATVAQVSTLTLVFAFLVAIIIYNLGSLIAMIISAHRWSDKHDKYLNKYRQLGDRQQKIRGDIEDIIDVSPKAWGFKNVMGTLNKVRIIREIKGLESSVKDLEKAVKRSKWTRINKRGIK